MFLFSNVDGNADLVGGVYCPMDSSGDIHLYCKNLGTTYYSKRSFYSDLVQRMQLIFYLKLILRNVCDCKGNLNLKCLFIKFVYESFKTDFKDRI